MSELPSPTNLNNDPVFTPAFTADGVDSVLTPEHLKNAPIHAEWEDFKNDAGYGHEPAVTISFEGVSIIDAGFGATLKTDWEGQKTLDVSGETLSIPDALQGNNQGERLVRATGFIAVENGCKDIDVDFRHPASLKQFIRVFGFERISFWQLGKFRRYEEVAYTQEEALEIVAENSKRGQKPDGNVNLRDVPSFEALVSVEGLDTTGWEAPIETAENLTPANVLLVPLVDPGWADPDTARRNYEALLGAQEDTKAVVLSTYAASGAIPDSLVPLIAETTGRDIPVLIVATDYGTDHGILEVVYDTHRRAVDAGATLIKDVNVNDVMDVVWTTQMLANRGLTGDTLDQAIIDQFGAAA